VVDTYAFVQVDEVRFVDLVEAGERRVGSKTGGVGGSGDGGGE